MGLQKLNIDWSHDHPHIFLENMEISLASEPRHQLGDGKVPRKAYDGLFWQQGLMSYMFNLAALFQIYFVINVLAFFYFLLLPIATTFWWIRSIVIYKNLTAVFEGYAENITFWAGCYSFHNSDLICFQDFCFNSFFIPLSY